MNSLRRGAAGIRKEKSDPPASRFGERSLNSSQNKDPGDEGMLLAGMPLPPPG